MFMWLFRCMVLPLHFVCFSSGNVRPSVVVDDGSHLFLVSQVCLVFVIIV